VEQPPLHLGDIAGADAEVGCERNDPGHAWSVLRDPRLGVPETLIDRS
jgi:hypothetical protein